MKKAAILFLLLFSFSLASANTKIIGVSTDKEIYEPGDLAKINVSVFSNEEKYLFPELKINFRVYKSDVIQTIGGEKVYSFYIKVPEKEGNYNLDVYLSDGRTTNLQKSTIITVKPLLRQFILTLKPLEQTATPGEIINYNLSITNVGSENERFILDYYNIQVYNLPKNYIEIKPKETKKMMLSVRVPELEDNVYEFKLKVCSTYNWACENITSTLGIYHRTDNNITFENAFTEKARLNKTFEHIFFIKNNNDFVENYLLNLTLPSSWFQEPTLLNQEQTITKQFSLEPGEEIKIPVELTPEVHGTHDVSYYLFNSRSDTPLISGVFKVDVKERNLITGAFVRTIKTKWFYGSLLLITLFVLAIIVYYLHKDEKNPYMKEEVKIPEIPKMNIVKDQNRNLQEWKNRI